MHSLTVKQHSISHGICLLSSFTKIFAMSLSPNCIKLSALKIYFQQSSLHNIPYVHFYFYFLLSSTKKIVLPVFQLFFVTFSLAHFPSDFIHSYGADSRHSQLNMENIQFSLFAYTQKHTLKRQSQSRPRFVQWDGLKMDLHSIRMPICMTLEPGLDVVLLNSTRPQSIGNE